MGIINSRINFSGRNFMNRSPLPIVRKGPFNVGYTDIMVEAKNDEDVGVFARIFYPADKKASFSANTFMIRTNQYWRPRKEYLDGLAAYKNLSPRKVQTMFDLFVGDRQLPCELNSPILSDAQDKSCRSFPVVIFSHGLSSCRLFSSSYCASLASYGFVVAAIEHRDRSACWTYTLERSGTDNALRERPITYRKVTATDNEFRVRNQQLHRRVAECVKLLNVLEEINLGTGFCQNSGISDKLLLGREFDWEQFKGRLDLSSAAVVGHSFGGATAICLSAFSTELRSAVVLDGWMFPIEKDVYPRALQPTLFLNAERFQWAENVQSMHRVGNESSKNFIFTIRDATHYSFTDLPFVVPSFLGRKLNFQGDTDSLLCLEAYVELSAFFLKKSFKGGDFDFNDIKAAYRDILFEGSSPYVV